MYNFYMENKTVNISEYFYTHKCIYYTLASAVHEQSYAFGREILGWLNEKRERHEIFRTHPPRTVVSRWKSTGDQKINFDNFSAGLHSGKVRIRGNYYQCTHLVGNSMESNGR